VVSKAGDSDLMVVHITEAPLGGVLAHLEELIAEQLEDSAIAEIVLMGPDANARVLGDLSHPKLKIISYRSRSRSVGSLLRFAYETVRLLRRFKPDIVHIHSTFAGVIARPIAFLRLRRPAVVYCPHGWAFIRHEKSAPLYAWVERGLSYLCDKIICVSKSESKAATVAGISFFKSAVVPNGIRTAGAGRTERALGVDRPLRVLFVGRFDRQKGFDIFIETMRRLGDLAEGWAVGDFVVEKPAGLEIPKNIKLLGWQSRSCVAGILRSGDLLLMPSRWEGLPMIAIEAMKAGLPVFSSTAGGLSELVEEGITGRLLLTTNPSDIADAVRTVTPDQLLAFSRNSHKRFLTNYTARVMARQTSELYFEILKNRGRRSGFKASF
jgi:glycosyltransferase involved in cell wall biosynthesis